MTVETSAAPKTKPRWQPVPASKCVGCSKAVYENEKLVADERVFHKTCFKCEHCKKTVSLGNFASLNEKIYCKVRPDSARAARSRLGSAPDHRPTTGNVRNDFETDVRSARSPSASRVSAPL